jgi:hypothetical protein
MPQILELDRSCSNRVCTRDHHSGSGEVYMAISFLHTATRFSRQKPTPAAEPPSVLASWTSQLNERLKSCWS